MTEPGRLVVISGPSGVGKGTVVAALRSRRPGILLSVSVTTRAPRPGEIDGVHYRFLDAEEFDAMIAAHGLLEWAEFAGNRYGTPARPVLDELAAGSDVVLEIDVQGAAQIHERMPEAVLIFLAPPSMPELADRLRRRGTEDDRTIVDRLAVAQGEMAAADQFDHVVVNDEVDAAVDDILRILETPPDASSGGVRSSSRPRPEA